MLELGQVGEWKSFELFEREADAWLQGSPGLSDIKVVSSTSHSSRASIQLDAGRSATVRLDAGVLRLSAHRPSKQLASRLFAGLFATATVSALAGALAATTPVLAAGFVVMVLSCLLLVHIEQRERLRIDHAGLRTDSGSIGHDAGATLRVEGRDLVLALPSGERDVLVREITAEQGQALLDEIRLQGRDFVPS